MAFPPLQPPGPIESALLCYAMSVGGGPSCVAGSAGGASQWFSVGPASSPWVFPLESLTSGEFSAAFLALSGQIPVDATVDTDGAQPFGGTTTQFYASRDLEKSYGALAGAPGQGLLALRAYAFLTAQRIQQLADAAGLDWWTEYQNLLAQGFQPPAGWLSLIAPEYPLYTIQGPDFGRISDVGLAYELALHGILMAEAAPAGTYGGIVLDPSQATPLSGFATYGWEQPTANYAPKSARPPRVGTAMQGKAGLYTPQPYTFYVYQDASGSSALAAQGIAAVGKAIAQGFATLYTAATGVGGDEVHPSGGFGGKAIGSQWQKPGQKSPLHFLPGLALPQNDAMGAAQAACVAKGMIWNGRVCVPASPPPKPQGAATADTGAAPATNYTPILIGVGAAVVLLGGGAAFYFGRKRSRKAA